MKKTLFYPDPVGGTPLVEETQAENSESASQTLESSETPPTTSPSPSATDNKDRYINILETTLREQNAQIQSLMSAPRPVVEAPAPPNIEEEKQSFYNDPAGTTRKIINEALEASIKPLQEFVKGLRIDGSPFSNMMAKFRSDARFSEVLGDQQIVAAVEKIMEKTELNEINMQSAIVHASGLKAMGLLGTVAPAPVEGNGGNPTAAPARSPSSSSVVLPPHVRPSAAPTPAPSSTTNRTQRPPLTENQRRIMREQGFKTEEEYWKWMELPASEVAHTDFDKPRK